LELGDVPLSDGLLGPDQLSTPEARYPLDVSFCPACSLVQIEKTVPPQKLFGADYPYYSSFSDTLIEHSRRNVEARIRERELSGHHFAVELASNDGYLLQFYREKGIRVLGIDPAEGPVRAARERGIDSLQAFFNEDLARDLVSRAGQADVIHANNVLAHVPDSNGFVRGIATLLKDDGTAVIEVPYVRQLIDHIEFDTIYHEHLCYFSVTALVALFLRNGLVLNRVESLPIHGGSLRLFAEKREDTDPSVLRLLEEEERLGVTQYRYYENFGKRVESLCGRIRDLIVGLKSRGARLAGYGAAAKGTILLNVVGLDHEILDWVADRNVHKQGRYIPGVRLPIVAPEQLLAEKPDYVLILPWNFRDEIIEQQAEYRRRGGRFIVPVPEPEILAV